MQLEVNNMRNMFCKMTFGIFVKVMINVFSFSPIAVAQNVLIYPETPAVTGLNQQLTFMCKSVAHEEWRSTLFYDETESDGLSSVGLFHKNTDGSCKQSIISTKYLATCDIAKGEFNLTIQNIDKQYHDKIVSCTTQFGNGTVEDISVTKSAKIYVKVPVSDISLSETKVETDVSSNFTIRCSVVSRPAATFTWKKINVDELQVDITSYSQINMYYSIDGETVTSVLTFRFSKLDNNGFLQCKANNSFSVRQSRNIPLNVYYPPENIPSIKQVKPGPVDAGETVYLHCSVYGGYPIAKLIWDCPGLVTNQSSETLSAVILQLVVDRKYDGKRCSCLATHPDLSYKHTIQHTFTVYYSPSIPKLSTIPEMPWFVGNTTNVLCLSDEGNPKSVFQWFVNGKLKKENNSVLTIGPLTKNDDTLEIFCNVMNEYTTRHEILLTSEPRNLDVEYYPEIIFDNEVQKLFAVEGENFTVKCRSNGNPSAKVHWEASKVQFTVPEESLSVLNVYRIERDQQLFMCHAVSVSKKYGKLVTTKPIEIEVFYRPNVSKIEVMNTLPMSEGQPTTLQCQVDSNPLSNVSWIYTHNKTLLSKNNNVSKSYLNISSAHCLDNGIYQCKAVTTILGKLYSTTAQTNLSVICSPRTDNRYSSLPNKIAVALNESLNLTVRLIAFPYPLLNWYHLDTKRNFSTHVFGSTVITNMLVPTVQKTDLGQYTINAVNDAGSKSININVVEKTKPDIPSVLHLFCGSTTANIVWTIMYNGGDIQRFKVQYWADENGAEKRESNYLDDPGIGKSLKYEMNGLREKTMYYFQIIASNLFGESTTTEHCNTTGTYKQSHDEKSSQTVIIPVTIVAVLAVVVICILSIKLVYNGRKNQGWLNSGLRSRRTCGSSMSVSFAGGSNYTADGEKSRSSCHSDTETSGAYINPIASRFSVDSKASTTRPKLVNSGSRSRHRHDREEMTDKNKENTYVHYVVMSEPKHDEHVEVDIYNSLGDTFESIQSNA